MGPARLHQRDKMGGYFLWGYYNDHPVYQVSCHWPRQGHVTTLLTSDWLLQHYSGLDFLYFHANQVWGVGPKVGGKRAGLLNFAAVDCPYEVRRKYRTSYGGFHETMFRLLPHGNSVQSSPTRADNLILI